MKKLINTAMTYFGLAIAAGVFYREWTKLNGFSGKTALGVIHVHLFVLGMLLFLLLALFAGQWPGLAQDRRFRQFFVLYNVSLPLMACTLLARGLVQVSGMTLARAVDASISGVAGVAHLLMTASFILLFVTLKKHCAQKA